MMDAAQVGCCLYEAGPGTSLTISLLQQCWSGLRGSTSCRQCLSGTLARRGLRETRHRSITRAL
jgi:hypothetical protein